MNAFYLLIPVFFPVLAGLAVYGIPALRRESRVRNFYTAFVLLAELGLLIPVLSMGNRSLTLFTLSDTLPVFLHVDKVSLFFACVMAFVWAMTGLYSFEYMAHEENQGRFYACYICTLGILIGLCLSGSVITFYMFYELMTLITTPLVMHTMQKDAVAAGIKYLIYSILGASLALLGVFMLSPYVTTFSFTAGGVISAEAMAGHETTVLVSVFLMLLGFGTKGGLFPLHGWLPTAHPAAPSPASAVLSGVITKAGVLGTFRLLYDFAGADLVRGTWVQTAALCLTLFTVFMGSLLAYREGHLKKRLAWSSVSQVSYVLFGLNTLSPLGVTGALLHVAAHSLIKATLFMSAGAVICKTGKTQVSDLRGMGRRMPVVMACFTVASLGLVGIPPCLGFISKWFLAQGSLSMTSVPAFLTWLGPVVLLVSALLTAGYLLTVSIRGFFPGHDAPSEEKCEPSRVMLIPMLLLALIMVVLGTFPGALEQLFAGIVSEIL